MIHLNKAQLVPEELQEGWSLWRHPGLQPLLTLQVFPPRVWRSEVPGSLGGRGNGGGGVVACRGWTGQPFKRLHLGRGQMTS